MNKINKEVELAAKIAADNKGYTPDEVRAAREKENSSLHIGGYYLRLVDVMTATATGSGSTASGCTVIGYIPGVVCGKLRDKGGSVDEGPAHLVGFAHWLRACGFLTLSNRYDKYTRRVYKSEIDCARACKAIADTLSGVSTGRRATELLANDDGGEVVGKHERAEKSLVDYLTPIVKAITNKRHPYSPSAVVIKALEVIAGEVHDPDVKGAIAEISSAFVSRVTEIENSRKDRDAAAAAAAAREEIAKAAAAAGLKVTIE